MKAHSERTTGACGPRWILAALLAVFASAATAAAPREAIITKEADNLYRAGITNPYYLKTVNCSEQIFGDRVTFRWNLGTKGGVFITRTNNKMCFIEKVLREVDVKTMQPLAEF